MKYKAKQEKMGVPRGVVIPQSGMRRAFGA